MTAKTIDQLVAELIEREGDYVNNPADRGGPTRWGITEAVARRQGYKGSMREFPRQDAAEIYRKIYWLAPHFDQVALIMPNLAAELFDTGINMGVGTAVGFLQRALNALNRQARDYPDITVDRTIGGNTLSALYAYKKVRGIAGEAVLLKAVEALQGAQYVRLAETKPSQESFLYGWLANRIGQ